MDSKEFEVGDVGTMLDVCKKCRFNHCCDSSDGCDFLNVLPWSPLTEKGTCAFLLNRHFQSRPNGGFEVSFSDNCVRIEGGKSTNDWLSMFSLKGVSLDALKELNRDCDARLFILEGCPYFTEQFILNANAEKK